MSHANRPTKQALSHDPLCPHAAPSWTADKCSQCQQIAQARADEREKAAQRVEALAWQAAGWPKPMSSIAKVAWAIDMGPSEPGLQEHCYECAGEAASYTLAILDGAAAARVEQS